MKLAVVLFGLSVAVMGVMIFQTLQQEINMRNLKTRTNDDSIEVKKKEEAIITMKKIVRDLKTAIASVGAKIAELKKKREEAEATLKGHEKNLETCNTVKAEIVKNKTGIQEAITKLKAGHEEEKKKAETEIQGLKQQILDRDKAICAFADPAIEEARKLCGISQ
ncbi:uncharacterized protein ACBR49_004871 [Aulostomus maculatus]